MKVNKTLYFILFFIFAVITLNCSKAEKKLYVHADGGLRMRSSSDTTSSIIQTIPQFASVVVTDQLKDEIQLSGKKGKWTKVKYDNQEGWVFGGFLGSERISEETKIKFYEEFTKRLSDYSLFFSNYPSENEADKLDFDIPTYHYSDNLNIKRKAYKMYDSANSSVYTISSRSALEIASSYAGIFHKFNNRFIEINISETENTSQLYNSTKKSIVESSTRLFGKSLILKEEKLYGSEVLYHYDPEVIKIACNSLIPKKDFEIHNQVTLRKFYNKMMRDLVWYHALLLKLLLQNKINLESDKNQYLTLLKKYKQNYYDAEEYRDYEENINLNSLPYEEMYFLKTEMQKDWHGSINSNLYKMKTFLMRRQHDGTLPVVLECIENSMKFFDPELHYNFTK